MRLKFSSTSLAARSLKWWIMHTYVMLAWWRATSMANYTDFVDIHCRKQGFTPRVSTRILKGPHKSDPKGKGEGSSQVKKLEHGCRMIYAGVPSFFGFGLEHGHVSTFWLLL